MEQARHARLPRPDNDFLHGFAVHSVEGLVSLLRDDADEMNDRLAAARRALERGRVEYVARDDLDLSVVAIASGPGPARQHSDCVPPPQKSVDQVRAHEASAAGDEDLQFQSPIGAFNITAVVNQSGDRAKTIG